MAKRKKPAPKAVSIAAQELSKDTLEQLIAALPAKTTDNLSPRERILLAGVISGADETAIRLAAGLVNTPDRIYKTLLEMVLGKAEQSLQISEIIRLMGLSDFRLAGRLVDLVQGEDLRVALGAVKLAAQLKGHMSEQVTMPPATEIHLHIMTPGEAPQENSVKPGVSKTSESIDIDKLLP